MNATAQAGLRWQLRSKVGPDVSVIVPTLNERANLESVIPELAEVLRTLSGRHEVILVDGGSMDGTVETACRLLPSVRVFNQSRRGKGNAVATGLRHAVGDIVVMFDADGSADPAEIPAFIEALVCDADFAKGTRFAKGGGSSDITLVRRLGNAGLRIAAQLNSGTRFTDLCYGYNAFWRDMTSTLALPHPEDPQCSAATSEMVWGDGFEIETLINLRMAHAEAVIAEVPSIERRRIHGESNLNTVRDGLRVLRTILHERSGTQQPSVQVLEQARKRGKQLLADAA